MTAVGVAYLAWALAATLRALFVFAGWQGVRTAAAAAVLTALFAAFVEVMPRAELWVHRDLEAERAAATAPSIVDERFFHRQQKLLDEALARLERERPGVEDLYFVGVAPYASQDVFARELTAVKKLIDERFDTDGRSMVLVNSPTTLHDTPIATATNLRAVLERVGRLMNPEEDVLFLFITTHGDERHELAFELPPLHAAAAHSHGARARAAGLRHQVEGPGRLGVLFGRVRRTAQGREHGRHHGRGRDEHLVRLRGRARLHLFRARLLRRGARPDVLVHRGLRDRAGERRRAGARGAARAVKPQIFVGNAVREKLVSIERRLAMPH